MNGSLRFGGTMEIAGLNEQINPLRVQGIIDAAQSTSPNSRPTISPAQNPGAACARARPTAFLYLGRTRHFSNLTIATGHAMMGLSLGPITGKLVSEIIDGEHPAFPLELLWPKRFG